MYHITAAEIMNEVPLEALVRIPKPCVPKLRTAEQCETLTGENGSLSAGFQPKGEEGACRMRSLPSGSRG